MIERVNREIQSGEALLQRIFGADVGLCASAIRASLRMEPQEIPQHEISI